MSGKKGMTRPVREAISVLVRVDKSVYKKLLRLKIIENSGFSFNKYLNRILAGYVNENSIKIKDHEVDYSEFD